jgi:hypothetical protein
MLIRAHIHTDIVLLYGSSRIDIYMSHRVLQNRVLTDNELYRSIDLN